MLKKLIFRLVFVVLISGCSADSGTKKQTTSHRTTFVPATVDSLHVMKGNPLWPEHVPSNYHDKINYSKESVRIGKLIIEENIYETVIFNSPGSYPLMKYDDVSFIWIDINNNNKYDFYEDILEQMYLPFTIKNNAYEVIEVDSLGRFVQYERCNPEEFAAIGVGLPAPNFKAMTLDSLEFQLTELRGHPIFLYFWSCNPFYHSPHVKKVATHFSNSDLKIVCVGNYAPIIEGEKGNSQQINWIHINEGSLRYEARLQYQVGALPKLFIIDKEGLIQSINVEFMSDKLIEIVDQYL